MDEDTSKSLSKARTRQHVATAACNRCRRRRSRCDEGRPECSTCQSSNQTCVYETRPGERRMAALYRENLALQKLLAKRTTRSSSACSANADSSSLGSPASSPSVLSSSRGQSQGGHQFGSTLRLSRAVTLLNALTETSDHDSSLLLAKLRLGDSWGELVDTLNVSQDGARFEQRRGSSSRLAEGAISPLAPRYHALGDGRVEDEGEGEGKEDEETEKEVELPGIDGRGPQSKSIRQPSYTIVSRRRTRHDCSFDRNVWMQRGRIPEPYDLGGPDNLRNSGLVRGINSAHHIFGNMTFTDAIGANHYPAATQTMQQNNLKLPFWAMRLAHISAFVGEPFDMTWLVLTDALNEGADVDALCGHYVCLDALDNEKAFHAAPLLSQVIANMVRSIKSDEAVVSTTQYALMWLHWLLWKWIVNPSSESYEAIPLALRPQACQFFIDHVRVYDFVVWPALRQRVCSQAVRDLCWLTEVCKTLKCDWSQSAADALFRDGTTGLLDLNPMCKSHLALASSWSMGPSVGVLLLKAGASEHLYQPMDDALTGA